MSPKDGNRLARCLMADKPSTGLADIIAASTAWSDIDGRAGLLFYRGYHIHQLAGSATFEEIASLPRVMGQPADNQLIRPDGEYVGEPGLTWTPLDRR
jgi:citrate synthase